LRFLHVLVGDGVNTNENSAKRLLHKFIVNLQAGSKIVYRLLVWKCFSHQANLVVLVAIAGGLVLNPLDSNELCGTLSRLYKFLVPAYLDEFTGVLRNMVVTSFRLCHDLHSEDTRRHQDRSRTLVALYGDGVLPPALMRLRNRDSSSMEHLCQAGTDERVVRKDMFDLLLRLVWLVEEKPVITRVFSVRTVLLCFTPHGAVGLTSGRILCRAVGPRDRFFQAASGSQGFLLPPRYSEVTPASLFVLATHDVCNKLGSEEETQGCRYGACNCCSRSR
jgi:hypothetical protein